MTHRILSAFLCLCMGTLSVIANDAIVKNLSDDHAQERVETDFGFITFIKGATESDNTAPISVEIENTTEKFVLIVFGTPYNQKALKSLGFSFDKHFAGEKGTINSCDNFKFEDADIMPQQSRRLNSPDLVARDEGLVQFILPIYIAQPCGPKKDPFSKYKLIESRLMNITLHVEMGPDTYKELSKLYEDLKHELEGQTFCTDASHKEEQTALYKKRINELKKELQQNRDSLWYNRNDKYKDFEQLINQLNGIQFNNEETCSKHKKVDKKCKTCRKDINDCPYQGNHPIPIKKCPTCRKPINKCEYDGKHPDPVNLKTISGEMNGILTKLDNHKISKDAAVEQANSLLNKAKTSLEWKTSSYNKTITNNHYKIVNHK